VDIGDSPEEATFRAEARAFLERHARPRQGGALARIAVSSDPEAERQRIAAAKAWQATLFDHGWAGISWPVEHGGRGGSLMEEIIFAEEQARFDVPTSVFAQGIGMAGPTLLAHGTAAQCERYLRPMLRGDEIWCQLFSEPGAGSDLASLSTRAEADGDAFVVTGQKVWTSSAHYADLGILLARTNPDVPKHQGITYFLLDMRSPGIEVRPLRQLTGGADFNEVFLDGVRVPAANVVGQVDDGWRVAMTTLGNERALIAAPAVDIWPDLLALARRRGRTTDPVLRQELARCFIRLRILGYLRLRTLTQVSRRRQPGPEASVAKLGFSRHLAALGDLLMAVQGCRGMLAADEDPDTARAAATFLGQWASRIGGGTEQIQATIVAERALGLPKEPTVDRDLSWRELHSRAD
jgi:alkylation response protein AidB-like acyl-CoA dehydrogenase